MADQLTTVLDNVEREITFKDPAPPSEVARFAPPKLRPATISTICADVRKACADLEQHTTRLRAALDEMQRFAS